MTETLDGRPRLGEISESGVDEYKPLSVLAVAGLVFGLLSPLAFVGPLLYIFGIVGAVLSVVALARIGTESPALTGRKLALAGLVLSTVCISIAPSHRLVSRHLLRSEARRFASEWFRFLANNEPRKAHQLSKSPQQRLTLDDQLWDVYGEDSQLAEGLRIFTEKAPVRKLLAWGDGARIGFCGIPFQGREFGDDTVTLLYAISPEEEGQKALIVVLNMQRVADAGDGRASWYISDIRDYDWAGGPPS